MVIALRRTTRDGKPYLRRQEIERLLEELDELTPDDLLDQCINSEEPVPFEVLIYFLRNTELGLSRHHLETLFLSFHSRLEAALRRNALFIGLGDSVALREETEERIFEMLALDRSPQQDKMRYWEVNFNHALNNCCKDVLRSMGPQKVSDPLIQSIPLTKDSDEGLEVLPEVEEAAADLFDPNSSLLDEPAFRLRFNIAINDLPDDERRAIGLKLQGMQQESKDPTVMTIAKALECTDRTVRNRLSRAYTRLRTALEEKETI